MGHHCITQKLYFLNVDAPKDSIEEADEITLEESTKEIDNPNDVNPKISFNALARISLP